MARGGADSGGIIKILLLGAGGYFLYDWYRNRPASMGVVNTDTGSGSTPGAPNAIDALYAKLLPTLGSQTLSADGFNYSLQQQLPLGKTAPAPETFLPAGVDRTATMTFAQYWNAITPALKTTLGLSGLGVYEGLYQRLQAVRSIHI